MDFDPEAVLRIMIANFSQTQSMAWRLVSDTNLRVFNLLLALAVSNSRNLRNLEVGFATSSIDPFSSVRSVRDLPTVGFSKPLKI